MSKKEMTFEEKMMELLAISKRLESGDETLEEMLKDFEQGVKVYRECFQMLEATESKITMIMEEAGKIKTVPVDPNSKF